MSDVLADKDDHLEEGSGSVVGAGDNTDSVSSEVLDFLVPHTKLWDFIEGTCGCHDRGWLALDCWEDFELVFRSNHAARHAPELDQNESLNMNGSRESQHRLQNFSVLWDGKYVICFLQETRTTSGDKTTWLLKWQGGVCMSHLTHKSGEMAILLAQRFQPEMLGVKKPVPGRLLHLTVRLGGTVFHFVNVYAHLVRPKQTRFYGEVSTHFATIDEGQCVVLSGVWGHFNCILEDRDHGGAWTSSSWTHFVGSGPAGEGSRGSFHCLRLWWDVAKSHIHLFCQVYVRVSTKRQKSRIKELEGEVLDLESRYVEQSLFHSYTGTIPHLFLHYIDDWIGAASCSQEELE
eukprot:g40718.t1